MMSHPLALPRMERQVWTTAWYRLKIIDYRFFEAEPDADLYDVPDRDIFDKFPNNDEDRESHDIATSSFSDDYKCFWR